MQALLRMSRGIDAFTKWIGKRLAWLILIAVIVATLNAIVRKTLDISSNSWLELQWLLFSAVFLLCSPWTLLDNEHIRIDIVNNLLPKKLRDSIDVVRTRVFSVPAVHRYAPNRSTFLPSLLRAKRAIRQCWRTCALAWQIPNHDRICIFVGARHVRTHKTNCCHAWPHTGPTCGTGPPP